MVTPSPKPRIQKPELTPEEMKAQEKSFLENALFAMLGAICALITGLGLYGEFKSPAKNDRNPASAIVPSEARVDER
jgi:hypothetical protein